MQWMPHEMSYPFLLAYQHQFRRRHHRHPWFYCRKILIHFHLPTYKWMSNTHVDFSFFHTDFPVVLFLLSVICRFHISLFVCLCGTWNNNCYHQNQQSQHFYGLIYAAAAALDISTQKCAFFNISQALQISWVTEFRFQSSLCRPAAVFALTLFHVFKRNKCHWN